MDFGLYSREYAKNEGVDYEKESEGRFVGIRIFFEPYHEYEPVYFTFDDKTGDWQCIKESDRPLWRGFYSALFTVVIIASFSFLTIIGVKGNNKNRYDYYLQYGGEEAVVVNNSKIYYEVDYMIGSTYCLSSYPLDIHIPFGMIKKGTTVHVIYGKEYDECEVVTEDGKAGFIDCNNIKYN